MSQSVAPAVGKGEGQFDGHAELRPCAESSVVAAVAPTAQVGPPVPVVHFLVSILPPTSLYDGARVLRSRVSSPLGTSDPPFTARYSRSRRRAVGK